MYIHSIASSAKDKQKKSFWSKTFEDIFGLLKFLVGKEIGKGSICRFYIFLCIALVDVKFVLHLFV